MPLLWSDQMQRTEIAGSEETHSAPDDISALAVRAETNDKSSRKERNEYVPSARVTANAVRFAYDRRLTEPKADL